MSMLSRVLILGLFSLLIIACSKNEDPAEKAYRNSLTATSYGNRLDAIESELQGSQDINFEDPKNAVTSLASKDAKSLNRIKSLLDEYIEDGLEALDYGSRPGVVFFGKQQLRNRIVVAKGLRDAAIKQLTTPAAPGSTTAPG